MDQDPTSEPRRRQGRPRTGRPKAQVRTKPSRGRPPKLANPLVQQVRLDQPQEQPSLFALGDLPRSPVLPGHKDFRHAVSLVREARLLGGKEHAWAVWQLLGLPGGESSASPRLQSGRPDPVHAFAKDGVEARPGAMTPAAGLWPAFQRYCAARGLAEVSMGQFRTRFGRLGFDKCFIGGRIVYIDLAVSI